MYLNRIGLLTEASVQVQNQLIAARHEVIEQKKRNLDHQIELSKREDEISFLNEKVVLLKFRFQPWS
jgi:hypothetical protein